MLDTNVKSVIHLTETLLPFLESDGRIINVSSICGKLNL